MQRPLSNTDWLGAVTNRHNRRPNDAGPHGSNRGGAAKRQRPTSIQAYFNILGDLTIIDDGGPNRHPPITQTTVPASPPRCTPGHEWDDGPSSIIYVLARHDVGHQYDPRPLHRMQRKRPISTSPAPNNPRDARPPVRFNMCRILPPLVVVDRFSGWPIVAPATGGAAGLTAVLTTPVWGPGPCPKPARPPPRQMGPHRCGYRGAPVPPIHRQDGRQRPADYPQPPPPEKEQHPTTVTR